MHLGIELIGKPVFGITDGRKIGEIKDLYIDQKLKKVYYLNIGQMGLLRRKVLIVRREDVMVFGVDSILTKNSDVAIESGKEIVHMISRETLRGRDVLTVGDTRVGKVQDLILDDELHIIGFELGRIYVEGPIADRGTIAREALLDIQPIGESLIIDFGTAEVQDLGVVAQF
jgi:uncharacterized protein YrrD